MGAIASQITNLTIVYSTVYSDADQRKYQSPASLAFVWGIFPEQMASNAENVSIWWRHHDCSDEVIMIAVMRNENASISLYNAAIILSLGSVSERRRYIDWSTHILQA